MVNILFCGNDKVFGGMLTCALSIVKRSPKTEPYTFYLFTMDATHLKDTYTPLTEAHRALLEGAVQRYHSESRVLLHDVGALYRAEFDGCPNEDAYCSPYTLLRLLADLVDGMPDKLLYLDVDLLFQRDVHLLYDIDLSDYEYAAARDHYGKYLICPNYINAGVMLWNFKRMKETRLLEKARGHIKRKKLLFADQSAILRATTKKKMLPQRYNDQKFLHRHTVVRHFSKRLFWLPYPHVDNVKQWQVEKMHRTFGYHQFDDILEEYQALITALDRKESLYD